jgi:hypothetical protein
MASSLCGGHLCLAKICVREIAVLSELWYEAFCNRTGNSTPEAKWGTMKLLAMQNLLRF